MSFRSYLLNVDKYRFICVCVKNKTTLKLKIKKKTNQKPVVFFDFHEEENLFSR